MIQIKINKRDILSFAKPYGYIYKIENIINGKIYVGQTINKKGYRSLVYGYINNLHLINSIKKYGIDKFERKIIDSAKDKKDLDKKEEYYILKYNTLDRNYGYNFRHGGSRGKHSKETRKKISELMKGKYIGEKNHFYGKHHTLKSKKKMSEAKKGKLTGDKNPSKRPEVRKKMSEKLKGKPAWNKDKKMSEEFCKKISKANKGRKFTDEWKQKISKGLKGRIPWNKGMNKEQMKQYKENK